MDTNQDHTAITPDSRTLDALIARWPSQMETHHAKEMVSQRAHVRGVVLRHLSPDVLPTLDENGLREVVRTLWASGTWKNKDYLADLVLRANPLAALRQNLQNLLFGQTPLEDRINAFLGATKHMGPSTVAELLFWVHPDTCWLANRALFDLEETLGFDISTRLASGKKRDPGARYMAHEPFVTLLHDRLSATGVSVHDFRDVDAFVYYAWLEPRPGAFDCVLERDPGLKERFVDFLQRRCPAERLEHRRQAEEKARNFLERHLGAMDPAQFREFLQIVNSDLAAGKVRNDRFSPAFSAVWVNELLESLDAINEWSRRLWQASDADLPDVLAQFWAEKPIRGAGQSLPTLILYLRSPETFAIRMGVLDKGIRFLFPKADFPRSAARSYDLFNRLARQLSEKHGIAPQALDMVLTFAAKVGQPPPALPEFTEESFRYLQDLAQNNNTDWMHQNLGRYRTHVRDALEALTKQVAETLVKPEFAPFFADDPLETSATAGRCISRIGRNAFGRGDPYNAHMWSAFFRKSQGKRTDAQLFAILRPDFFWCGFGFGNDSARIRAEFRERIKGNADRIWRWIEASPEVRELLFVNDADDEPRAIEVASVRDLVRWVESEWPAVCVRMAPGDTRLQRDRVAPEVIRVLRAVFPLFVVATRADWEAKWDELARLPPRPNGGEKPKRNGPELIENAFDLDWLVETTGLEAEKLQEWVDLIKKHRQVILFGPPGTGKTFLAKALARHLAGTDDEGLVRMVQFHPAYCYEDFIEGLRPDPTATGFSLRVVPGAFKTFCQRVSGTQTHVMVIDELNRGNVAKVFGELMYLLEYRDDDILLPRSSESFRIPDNVFLIGTMNTADRSIALVDYALRRRFRFIEVQPSPEVLQQWLDDHDVADAEFLVGMFRELNERLEKSFGRHLKLGHSYFMDAKLTRESLPAVWNYAILPLVEEYAFGEAKRLKDFAYDAVRKAVEQQQEPVAGVAEPVET